MIAIMITTGLFVGGPLGYAAFVGSIKLIIKRRRLINMSFISAFVSAFVFSFIVGGSTYALISVNN